MKLSMMLSPSVFEVKALVRYLDQADYGIQASARDPSTYHQTAIKCQAHGYGIDYEIPLVTVVFHYLQDESDEEEGRHHFDVDGLHGDLGLI